MLLRWQSLHYTSLNLGLCRILTPQFRSRLVSDLVLDIATAHGLCATLDHGL